MQEVLESDGAGRKGSMPVETGTEAVGDVPNVFTGLQGDIMAGAVCMGGGMKQK